VKFLWPGPRRLAPVAANADLPPMSKTPKPFKVTKTRWNEVVLVCRKCSKKLDGGFGPDGDQTLKKALRRYLHAGKGRKADLAVLGADCFDVCPRSAVVAVNARRPEELLIVPAGADLFEVKARLGLDDGRRLKPALPPTDTGSDPVKTTS